MTVISRQNTGAGFFTHFAMDGGSTTELPDLLDLHVEAEINGIQDGLGFILWTKNGQLDFLEGYTLALDTTEGLDLAALDYKLNT
jgi:hypothetical protein